MLRLFVGLALPPEHRLRLSLLCSGLERARWVDPGNFHVTLRFIGEVHEGVAADIDEALATIRAPRFSLSIAGLGVFGPIERPRSLHALVERSDELIKLRERVEFRLARIGLPPDERRYHPHVTLAGFRSGDSSAALQRYIAAHNLVRLEPFEIDRFSLIVSYLTKSGSIYEDAADYPLR